MTSASTLVATWFGCGFSPVAPGTAGSLAAVALAWAAVHWFAWPAWAFGVAAGALVLPAAHAAGRFARRAGRGDPSQVVVDEVAGQWITIAGATALNWKTWIAAFLLFRLFDIVKPPPVRQAESLPGGYGIVADDVVAGLYGALVLFAAGCFNLY